MVVEILWVSLVLGGLFASLWHEPTWRGFWLRLARPWALAQQLVAVWRRPRFDRRQDPGSAASWPDPLEVTTRPGPSPHSVHGYGVPSTFGGQEGPNPKLEIRNSKQTPNRNGAISKPSSRLGNSSF